MIGSAKIDFIDIESVPECAGVYIIREIGGDCLYIGASLNLKSRLGNSHQKGKLINVSRKDKKLTIIKCHPNGVKHLERHYINVLRPVFNLRLY